MFRIGWASLASWIGLIGLTYLFAAVQTNGQDPQPRLDYLGDPLPPNALLRLGTKRFSPGNIYYLESSGDDQTLLTLGPEICGWDAHTGKRLWTLENSREQFRTAFMTSAAAYGFRPMVLLPKSNRLILSMRPGVWEEIDFRTGQRNPSFTWDTSDIVCSVDVNGDESLLAIGTAKGLSVCDKHGTKKFTVENHPATQIERAAGNDRLAFGGEFSYARFSPDGKKLVLVNSEQPKTLQVLDANSGTVLKKVETKGRVVRIDFSSDSRFLATTERDIAARFYDLDEGELVWERVFTSEGLDERYTTDLQFSPNGDLIAVGTAIGEDNRIQLLDPQNGTTLGTLDGHTWKPWCLKFQRDGKRLFSSGWDGVIRVWDIDKREQIRVENSERASSVCTLTQDGRKLAYCDDSGKLHIVESSSGMKLRTIQIPGVSFSQLAFSADGKTLVAGGASKINVGVYVWNIDQEESLNRWEWPKGRDVHSSIDSLSLTPDGKRLAVAVFRQSKCYVFDLSSNEKVAEFTHRSIYGLGLHPDGNQLVTAGWDNTVRLWNVDEVKAELEMNLKLEQGGDARMYGVKFSPDKQRIAALHLGQTVSILDPNLMTLRAIPFDGRAVYDCFNFSKNGLWIAVGQMSGEACILDVNTGELLWKMKCHDGHIYNIEFGPDDRSLLTGGEDGVVYLWDLNTTLSPDETDVQKLALDLVSGKGLAAFGAFQVLATKPLESLPTISERVAKTFESYSTFEPKQVDKFVQRLNQDHAVERSDLDQLFESGLGLADAVERALSELVIDPPENDPRQKNLQELRGRLDQSLWDLSRAFYLVAILDSAEADQRLNDWLDSSPNANIKKQVFLAKKYRAFWHSRRDTK